MKLVLDASATIAWCITRANPSEAGIAQQSFMFVSQNRTIVPSLWYSEVINTLLVFERTKQLTERDSTAFLADLATLWIDEDQRTASESQQSVLAVARKYSLTSYHATYLELALRTSSTLATFDRKLAEAARAAGVTVFADTI
jgi:predicted nucleic acid-binding protein